MPTIKHLTPFRQSVSRKLLMNVSLMATIKTVAITSMTTMLAMTTVPAYAEDIVSRDSKCKINNPYPQDDEYVTWSGSCVDGYAEGQGTMVWFVDGEKDSEYIGTLKQGIMHGNGEITYYPSDDYEGGHYKGEFKDDMSDGYGVYTWTNGSHYEGEWKEDEKSGMGRFTLVAGDEAIEDWAYDEQGYYIDDDDTKDYIIEGIFYEDDLLIECDIEDKEACKDEMFDFLAD